MNNEKAKIQNFKEKNLKRLAGPGSTGASSTWGKTLEKMGSISHCF